MVDDLHLLYLETRDNRLDWLAPDARTEAMQDVVGVDDMLLLHGFQRISDGNRDVAAQQAAHERASLTRVLGDEASQLARFFGTLNWLASDALKASQGSGALCQRLDSVPRGRNAEILQRARELGLLHWGGDTEVVFASREAAAYFAGGWLEEFVATKLRGLRPKEHAVNLRIGSAGGTGNEIDALAVHRNRALLIECKTARFGRDTDKDQAYVYKLAQLTQQVSGLTGRSLLLSARPVQQEVRQRAREYKVDVLAAEEISQFVAYVKTWMGDSVR
ncbi:DUF1887 family CARF protein [uncultured Azohydromonas sp.]|jgi:Domain of unknown function (DUF1887).|uniref:Card1-like endonuclease domain-containing protein n=1 Tax=uncultured Azohydromonas sp. TaxID=487342 RepID=UPI002618690A|nr:DUF1887 family CARF protein [uncultured Azohydromonas sp.]